MPKIIYLDQNKWIDIACCYTGKGGYEKYGDVCKRIYEKVNSGEWIFPLSAIHLMETASRQDKQSRLDLAKVMGELSKSYTISSYLDMKKYEFDNLLRKLKEETVVDLSFTAIKKDFLNMVGLSDDKIISNLVDNKQIPLARNLIQSNNIFYFLMKEGILDNNISDLMDDKIYYKESFEKLRKDYQRIPDKYNEFKYRYFLAMQFFESFHDEILLNKDIFNNNLDDIIQDRPKEIIKFLESMPSFSTQFLLAFKIISNIQRNFDDNDFHDIIFLATAIPYCDIVITEKMWTGIIKNSNLSKRYNTIVNKDLNHLLSIE